MNKQKTEIATNKAVKKYIPRIVQSIVDQEKSKKEKERLENLQAENKQLKWKIEGLTAIIQNTEGKIVLKDE